MDNATFDDLFSGFVKNSQTGCAIMENFRAIQESLTTCINDLYEIETQVFSNRTDAERMEMSVTSTSAAVLKWTRLSALYGILSRAVIAHSPSDDDLVALAGGIVQRRVQQSNMQQQQDTDEPEPPEKTENKKRKLN
jgi:hypothetical protein